MAAKYLYFRTKVISTALRKGNRSTRPVLESKVNDKGEVGLDPIGLPTSEARF